MIQGSNLYHKTDQIRRFPRLLRITSMGNPVDEEGEADAVEDVVEEDLCGWVMVLVLVLLFVLVLELINGRCRGGYH